MPLFQHDDGGYRAWLDAHPDGFAVNTEQKPTPAYLVLHRATCVWVCRKNATSTGYCKFAAVNLAEAERFAEELGGPLHACAFCKPPGWKP